MAARIPMIATTIINSIRVKPFWIERLNLLIMRNSLQNTKINGGTCLR